MPGIVGIVTRNPNEDHVGSQLSTMLSTLLHERFYSHGTYKSIDLGCHIGWAIHKDSYSDCNPIINATKDVVMVFSGEHFWTSGNRPSSTDARNQTAGELLGLYEKKGKDFLSDLNGWFNGVVVDRRTSTVLIFNDRFGVHRVYYMEADDAFLFASEAKALLAVRPEARSLDDDAVGQFLVFGNTLESRTLFAHVSLMPPAASWTLTRASVRPKKERYFDVAQWERQPLLDDEAFYRELKVHVAQMMPEYFSARTGAAVSLTGGIDTRIIMAARPKSPKGTACYTYGGFYRNCYDVDVAQEIAAECGAPYQVIPLKRDFFENFAKYAERTVYLTDGSSDITGAHELYYSERARAVAPIRVTGNYGSEILRSVNTFKGGVPREDFFHPDVIRSCQSALEHFQTIKSGHDVTFAAMQNIPWHLHGRLAVAQSQLVVRSPYMDNGLVALSYRARTELRRSNVVSLRLIGELSPRLHAIRTDMGYGGTQSAIGGYPRRLSRYATFKAEWYYNLGMPEWLVPFDRVLLRPLSPLFLGSHKIDHFRPWFRDQLSGYLRDMLSDPALATRPYLNKQALRGLSARRVTGSYTTEISLVLSLELVHKTLLQPAHYGRAAAMALGSLS